MRKRKLTAVVLSLSMMIVHGTTTFAAEEVDKYDVDGNGIVQMADIVLLNHLICEDIDYCDKSTIVLYDLNNDGFATVEDLTMLMDYMRENKLFPDITTTTESTTTTTTTTGTTTTESTTTSTTTTETATTTTSTQITTTSAIPTQTTTTETTTGTTSTTTTSETTTSTTTTSTTTTSTTTTTTTTDTTTPSTTTDTTSVSKWVNPTRDEVIDKFFEEPITEDEYEYCLEFIAQYDIQYWDIRSLALTQTCNISGVVLSSDFRSSSDYGNWWYVEEDMEYLKNVLYPNLENEDLNFRWEYVSKALIQPYQGVEECFVSEDGLWIMQLEPSSYEIGHYYWQIVLLDEYGNELDDQNIFNYAKC